MKSIRQFFQRLNDLKVDAGDERQPQFRHRRITVPEDARFSLEGTFVRTIPVQPLQPFIYPGSLPQIVQLLEWIDSNDTGDENAFTDNDVGVDLTAILALATGRRIEFANELPLRYEVSQYTSFISTNHAFDGELYGPPAQDLQERVAKIGKALTTLPESPAFDLGGAIRARNAACCLVQFDHSSAYGLLVGALETLSRAFGNPPTAWDEWEQAEGWDRFMLNLGLTGQQATAIRTKILENKQIRLRRTFVNYIERSLDGSFWEQPYFTFTPSISVGVDGARPLPGTWNRTELLGVLVPQNQLELRRRLGRSYDARSEVFHQGARLMQSQIMPIPASTSSPLPFAGLRRILDYLLWREIEIASRDAPDLPDVQLFHSDVAAR